MPGCVKKCLSWTRNPLAVGITCIVVTVISVTCGVIVRCNKHVVEPNQDNVESKVAPGSHSWCLPFSALSHHRRSVEKLSRIEVDGITMCCANDKEQTTMFFEMLMSNTDTDNEDLLKRLNAESFSLSNASAHRSLEINTFISDDHDPVFWDDENMSLGFNVNIQNSRTQLTKNVEVQTSAIIILNPGIYYIYSSLFFKPESSKPCRDFKKQIWEHNIVHTRNNDKEKSGTILSTTFTCCDDCKENKETTYAGGIFELKENDRLHVEVSSDGVVRIDEDSSYLGLFLLQ